MTVQSLLITAGTTVTTQLINCVVTMLPVVDNSDFTVHVQFKSIRICGMSSGLIYLQLLLPMWKSYSKSLTGGGWIVNRVAQMGRGASEHLYFVALHFNVLQV